MMDLNRIFKSTALCLAMAGMMSSYSALAAGEILGTANLTIKGKVTASACEVASDSKNINVTLKSVEAKDMAAPGKFGDWEPINLHLINCPTTTTGATAVFSGTAAANPDLYANEDQSDNAAKFVQIELQAAPDANEPNKNLGDGATYLELIDKATNAATFRMQARTYTTEGGATPGEISGSVTVGISYN